MAVYQCAACPRLISGSIIPGGNPVARSNPDMWSATGTRCAACNALLCDRCAPVAGAACKLCSARAGKPAAGRNLALLAILLQAAFPFVAMMSAYDTPTRIAYWSGVALGVFAGWRMLAAIGRGWLLRSLFALTQLVPLFNLLALFLLRIRAASGPAKSMGQGQDAKQPAAVAGIEDWAKRLGVVVGQPVRGYSTYDFGRERDTGARSVLVGKDFPREQLAELRDMLAPGLILFLGTDRWLGDEVHEGKVELVLAPGRHPFDAVRIARVQPLNHGLDEEKVLAKLQDYDRQYGLELYEASSDSVSFRLLRVPAEGDVLAQDLLAFCPDLADAIATPAALMQAIREADGWITLWWD